MTETIAGGHFLVQSADESIFTPEDFDDEQRAFMQTALDFTHKEVIPNNARLEAKDLGFLRRLISKAGELGLLMAGFPEAYGGLGLDETTSMILAEAMGGNGSWSVTYGAQVGIGMLPIVYFGSEAQKQKYLPKLGSGEWVGAYALTEAGAGSDALGIRCRADVDGDDYVLNGTKQWITNGGIADVFTVFAKVDGSKFSAFIVERTDPGVSIGPEEHKLGLRGSSTTEVILEDVRIPKDRLLGRVGRGHRVAFGILYMGRLKLGIGTMGGTKEVLSKAIAYASERRQFDRSIIEFGMVREKLARMASCLYAAESMGYRTTGLIDAYIATPPTRERSHEEHVQSALEEYGIESAILKVYGSELLDHAVDEAMQIYGGYGYTEHYDIERIYRDSRINRIFEGTNEINRLLIAGTALRRSLKRQLPIDAAAARAQALIDDPSLRARAIDGPLAVEQTAVDRLKLLCAWAMHTAVSNNTEQMDQRQDILCSLANLITCCYAAESTVRRTQQMIAQHGFHKVPMAEEMCRVVVDENCNQGRTHARTIVASVLQDEALAQAARDIDVLIDRPLFRVSLHLECIAAGLAEAGHYRMPA